MRGKSSSSSRVKAMEVVERPSKLKEEHHLSGAYIRSLVKHLSSSRPKDQTMIPKSPDSTPDDAQTLQSPLPPPPLPPPTHPPKKQARRRLHTSRPYQERLLNMAEARREIVTALKFHRASMKQANEQQHQQQPPPPSPNPTPNIYQQNQPTFSNPSFTPFTCPSLPWSYLIPAPLPDIPDDLNLPLPNTPLGLNLNFQGFSNIDAPLYNSNTIKDPPSLPLSPHSSSSSYSSPPVHSMEALEAQTMALGTCGPNIDLGDQKLHLAMDEKEMAEIRSMGEKHDIEWNDTVNFVTSAWWSKFLETMEVDDSMDGHGFQVFDEAVDIPAWLKDGSGGDGNASHLLMQHLDDYCLQDASLPCLDIGEIGWLDGDWLS